MVNQEDVIDYFKAEFESLMHRFEDIRLLNYSIDKINEESLVDCNWSQQHINISFKTIPIDYYLSNPAHVEIFKINTEAYRNYFIQVARHEYAHSISCEAFNRLHSYILPLNEYVKCRINNQYFKIYLNDIFYDFIANYLVYEKIDNSIPEEHIELNFHSFQTTFRAGYKIIDLIKACLLFSQVFFIYAIWDKLNSVFTEFGVSTLLDYLYIINSIFKKIIVKNKDNEYMDMDSAISDITDLADILDSVNWRQMVKENHHNKSNIGLLENFKNNL